MVVPGESQDGPSLGCNRLGRRLLAESLCGGVWGGGGGGLTLVATSGLNPLLEGDASPNSLFTNTPARRRRFASRDESPGAVVVPPALLAASSCFVSPPLMMASSKSAKSSIALKRVSPLPYCPTAPSGCRATDRKQAHNKRRNE